MPAHPPHPPDEEELDLLLSRGRLTGPSAERLRARVLVAVARPPWWRRGPLIVPTLAFAALALVVGIRTWHPGSDAWRTKGRGGIGIELTCSGGTSTECPEGARLGVALLGAPPEAFVGAWADPTGGGERIWYFATDAEGGAARLGDAAGDVRLGTRSVVLGAEHRGAYIVNVVLSDRPLTRAQLLDPRTPGVLARTSAPLLVTPR